MTSETTRPSREEVFHAVKNLRRRYVLYYLQRYGGPVTLGELAKQVAAWENDTTVPEVSSSQRKSVYSALHQTHLPKLESAGVLNYDPDEGTIEVTERATRLDLQLASDPQTSLPWHRLYLGLSALSLGALASVWTGLYPFTLLSGVQYTLLVIAAFGVIAMAHTYDLRQWRQRADNAAPDFILRVED
ncbi:DUF7344 domain-containing protein [Halorussus lipolyticus]|uniref:DUF7344 domain-containing protein n=1 Tax=Halorussus lipolyticus TaxID=3034024 RepID=UPI0023E89257|nr:hypothetical protein [Halorussus sp. DT80]